MKLVIDAGQLFTPTETVSNARVLVDDGRIAACGPRESIAAPADSKLLDFPDGILAPGFIDLHIHGAGGHDCMEPKVSGLRAMASFLAQRGVTSFLPTIYTAPMSEMLDALKFLGKYSGKQLNSGKPVAVPLGIHLEGPFLNPARHGVHPAMHLRQPSTPLFDEMWNASGETVRMLTLAPELDSGIDLVKHATKLGVRVSIGHSNATFEQTQKAIAAGASHASHTFNAMRRMEHRDPGVLGAVLVDNRLTADIIADAIHVLPPVLDLFLRSKGRDRAVLATDASYPTGLPEGKYRMGAYVAEVKGLRCDCHGRLAGSVLTLDCAVQNVMQHGRWNLADAVRLATLNPARVLGIENRKGSIQPGADADIIVLTPNGEVSQTIVAGTPL